MLKTPILFLIFNRQEITSKVFNEIRKQKPEKLFIAADGPRKGVEDDVLKCEATRKIVLENIDWDCQVKTLLREENMGCGLAVSGAITWFFENVEEGIILEDDCLPHPSFFGYCKSLLDKYADNSKIFGICGTNFQRGEKKSEVSYFYSNYMFVWGWATWKRAWEHYDFEMKNYEKLATPKFFRRIDKRTNFKRYWESKFDLVYTGKIDTWDYQWLFTIWRNEGLIIVPNTNLISNIGFGSEATHTKNQGPFANLSTGQIHNLKPPRKLRANKRADRIFSRQVFNIGQKEIGLLKSLDLKLYKLLAACKKIDR